MMLNSCRNDIVLMVKRTSTFLNIVSRVNLKIITEIYTLFFFLLLFNLCLVDLFFIIKKTIFAFLNCMKTDLIEHVFGISNEFKIQLAIIQLNFVNKI